MVKPSLGPVCGKRQDAGQYTASTFLLRALLEGDFALNGGGAEGLQGILDRG